MDASKSKPINLNALSLPQLYAEICDCDLVERLIALARDEDLGEAGFDATSRAIIDPDAIVSADVVSREKGRLAGCAAAPAIIRAFDVRVRWSPRMEDGAELSAGDIIGSIEGSLASILSIERTLLNILSRLCGVATMTRAYVNAIELSGATRAGLYDTRKTTPGMRRFEKYAVRCGGGLCHRIGLFDAVLIKDNHLAGLSTAKLEAALDSAADKARHASPGGLRFFEVEVDTLEQFERICHLPAGVVDIVLLDNMTTDQLAQAVAMRDDLQPSIELEASGGVTLETIGAIACSGVDRISVGALTHSAPILDLGLDIEAGS